MLRTSNRYHLPSSGTTRTPRPFPPESQSVPPSPSRLKSPLFQARVSTILQQGDTYATRLDMERRRSVHLDIAVRAVRRQHFEARKALCDTTTARKSIGTLESRLEAVLVRYNDVCNSNKALRAQIQVLRRDKVQQVAVWGTLARETAHVSDETMQVVQASQAANEARDRATQQSEALRHHVTKDGTSFEAGWYEKTSQLTDDRALVRTLRRSYQLVRSAIVVPCATPSHCKLRNETQRHHLLLQAKATDLQQLSTQLRTREAQLAKIKRETGAANAQTVASVLLATEAKSFALVNSMNELTPEIEALQVAIQAVALAVTVATQEGEGVHATEDATRRICKQHLETQIEALRHKVARLAVREGKMANEATAMQKSALALFYTVHALSDERAVAPQEATEMPLPTLLGSIEQRVGELVDLHHGTRDAPTAFLRIPRAKPRLANDENAWPRQLRLSTQRRGGVLVDTTGAFCRPIPCTADEFESDSDDPQDKGRLNGLATGHKEGRAARTRDKQE